MWCIHPRRDQLYLFFFLLHTCTLSLSLTPAQFRRRRRSRINVIENFLGIVRVARTLVGPFPSAPPPICPSPSSILCEKFCRDGACANFNFFSRTVDQNSSYQKATECVFSAKLCVCFFFYFNHVFVYKLLPSEEYYFNNCSNTWCVRCTSYTGQFSERTDLRRSR